MKTFLTLIFISVLSISSTRITPDVGNLHVADNYKITKTKTTSTGATYTVKCTDCGKYITVYYKKSTKRYAQGDSPWYTQYKSLDKAAESGCESKCD